MAETVSPPTPKWVLMRRAISRGAGQHRLNLQAGQHLQFVEGVDVERIAGGHDEGAVVARQRHEAAAMHELERHGLKRGRLDRNLREIDQLHAELFGEGGKNIVFLGEAAFDEQLMQGLTRGGEVSLGNARQIGRRDAAASNQSLHQLHFRPRESAGAGGLWEV